ncbi:MAG TPA: MoxR family ATPase [Candidatus Dormibacteraeota bacterium]|nr:MoxR family ATPase [Candidatus Dormibacteraeota bacterium]
MENLSHLSTHIRTELSKVIVGQQEVVDQLLIVLVCGGHALLEGVPGLAKTLTVKTLARICGLGFQRVQCTADLMPADVIGTNVFNLATSSFSLHRGPIFTDLLLVDEINRTTARTQAALLEAMEERQATIDGVRHSLGHNFTVFATQNPIEFEGTYPLPEAQLDRFLMKIRIDYPSAEQEAVILKRFEGISDPHMLDQAPLDPLEPGLLAAAREEIGRVRVEPALYQYMVSVIRRTRDWAALSLGASPRAAIGLFFVARALAAMDGRDFLIPDDIKAAAPAVLRHRLLLKPEADLEGLSADSVIAEVLATVEVPKDVSRNVPGDGAKDNAK